MKENPGMFFSPHHILNPEHNKEYSYIVILS